MTWELPENIKKDLVKSEKELMDIVGAVAYYLYKNGLKWETVKQIIYDTTNRELDHIKKIIDMEKNKKCT